MTIDTGIDLNQPLFPQKIDTLAKLASQSETVSSSAETSPFGPAYYAALGRLGLASLDTPNPTTGRHESVSYTGAETNRQFCQTLVDLRSQQIPPEQILHYSIEACRHYHYLVALPATLFQLFPDNHSRNQFLSHYLDYQHTNQLPKFTNPQKTRVFQTLCEQSAQNTSQFFHGAMAEFLAHCFLDHAGFDPLPATTSQDAFQQTDLFARDGQRLIPVQVKSAYVPKNQDQVYDFAVSPPQDHHQPVLIHLFTPSFLQPDPQDQSKPNQTFCDLCNPNLTKLNGNIQAFARQFEQAVSPTKDYN